MKPGDTGGRASAQPACVELTVIDGQVATATDTDDADAVVIWLHGLGADGHDFAPIVPELGVSAAHRLRFVFPHAAQRPVTINGGYVMRAWYDILSPRFDEAIDEAGIADSVARLHALIAREIARGMTPERIFVAGFSQGGVIALQGGLTYPAPLGGILALSTYLPLPGQLTQTAPLPVFMGHGRQDPIVPFDLGRAAHAALIARGHKLEWHDYDMGHSVCPAEIASIGAWLNTHLR